MANIRWTAKSLIEALSKAPPEAEVSFDGCGCCSGDAGITFYKGGHPKWSKTPIAPWVSIGYIEKYEQQGGEINGNEEEHK